MERSKPKGEFKQNKLTQALVEDEKDTVEVYSQSVQRVVLSYDSIPPRLALCSRSGLCTATSEELSVEKVLPGALRDHRLQG